MKKFFTLLLCILMTLMLCGCGSNGGNEAEDGSIVIKLGGSGPLTGDAKTYGEAVRNAAQIAVDEINNSDSKIKFDLRFEDDAHDAEKAVSAYANLYDWGMQVSLYTVTSAPGAAVAKLYDEDRIFALTPSGSSTDLVYTSSENFEGNFQMCFTDPNQGVAAADYIAENFGNANIGIIYKSDDVYSAGIFEKFINEAKVKGLNIVYDDGAFTDDTSTDFSAQLMAAKDAGTDLLFMPIYYQPASLILKQAYDMMFEPTFFGVDGLDGILTLKGFDTSLAEGVYLLTPFAADSQDAKTKHFVEAYKNAYGEVPNQFAADAYDCVYAIHQALVNIGVDKDYDFDGLFDDVISQFLTMSFDGTTGNSVTWKENGEVSKLPKAVIITDGVYVSAD